MRHSWTLLLLAPALGCRTDYDKLTPIPRLVFTLADPEIRAGEEVEYLAFIDGLTPPVAVDPEILSDLDPSLLYGDGLLSTAISGAHTLTVTADHDGDRYEVNADLAVLSADIARVDLALADLSVGAGVELPYTLSAWDTFGNPVATDDVEVVVDSGDVELTASFVRSTVPGLYAAVASVGDVNDEEQFLVTAGAAASLTLTLSDTALELDETTLARVVVADAFGNPIDDPTLLWTDPVNGVGLNYNAVTFREEGNFTVWASTEDGVLTDSVGPLLIDSTGPDLVVTFPPRGTRTTELGQTVTGTVSDEWSSVAKVTVNGDAATLSGSGFSSAQSYDHGTNTLETLAVDGDGNLTTDIRAVMSGGYVPYGGGLAEGLQARVTESGFDVIEGFAEGFVDTSLLESSLPSPVLDESSKSCVFGVCVTWYSIKFYLENPSIGGTDLEIDPAAGGYLDTAATIQDAYLEYRAQGTLVGVSYSASGDITAETIRLDMNLWPSVSGGVIGVAVTDAVASTTNFDFYLDSWLYDVVDFFGIDIDGLIEGYLVDALADMAADEVPALVEDAVQGLEIAQSFEIEGTTVNFDAIPGSTSVDDLGLTLGLESTFTVDAWTSSMTADPGSLTGDFSAPNYSAVSADLAIGLNEDFLNQALFALWGGGLLEMEMSSEELGLDVSDLELFLPDLTGLTIGTRALLPPVVVPGSGSDLLDLQLGDLELSLYNGPADEANLFLRVYVTLDAGLGISASSDNTLLPALGDVNISFDLVYPNDRSAYAGDTEALLQTLVPMLLPQLTSALGEIPIPSFDGYGLSGISITLGGAEQGYVLLSGDLMLGG